jgi:hypothetical protein
MEYEQRLLGAMQEHELDAGDLEEQSSERRAEMQQAADGKLVEVLVYEHGVWCMVYGVWCTV